MNIIFNIINLAIATLLLFFSSLLLSTLSPSPFSSLRFLIPFPLLFFVFLFFFVSPLLTSHIFTVLLSLFSSLPSLIFPALFSSPSSSLSLPFLLSSFPLASFLRSTLFFLFLPPFSHLPRSLPFTVLLSLFLFPSPSLIFPALLISPFSVLRGGGQREMMQHLNIMENAHSRSGTNWWLRVNCNRRI